MTLELLWSFHVDTAGLGLLAKLLKLHQQIVRPQHG